MQKINEVKGSGYGAAKVVNFFKKNLINFILGLICVVYIFFGTVSIVPTGKTIFEIIAYSIIAFVVGFSIKTIWKEKGIQDGVNSDLFQDKIDFYGSQKEKIQGFSEELDSFCDYENTKRLIKARENYLYKYNLKYENFKSGKYDQELDTFFKTNHNKKDRAYKKAKQLEKVLNNVKKIGVYQYTSVLITNAYDTDSNRLDAEKRTLGASINKYRSNSAVKGIVQASIIALLFGLFCLQSNAWSWAAIIWYAFQVSTFLINGVIQYFKGYNYITQNMRAKVERVINIIDEFINLRIKNPKLFVETEEIIEKEEENVKELVENEKDIKVTSNNLINI